METIGILLGFGLVVTAFVVVVEKLRKDINGED